MSTLRTVLVLTPALLLWLCGCGASNPPPPMLFGHVASVHDASGTAQRGIRLAVDQSSKEITAESGRALKVLHAESHGKLETLEAEAVRLVSVNRVLGL